MTNDEKDAIASVGKLVDELAQVLGRKLDDARAESERHLARAQRAEEEASEATRTLDRVQAYWKERAEAAERRASEWEAAFAEMTSAAAAGRPEDAEEENLSVDAVDPRHRTTVGEIVDVVVARALERLAQCQPFDWEAWRKKHPVTHMVLKGWGPAPNLGDAIEEAVRGAR